MANASTQQYLLRRHIILKNKTLPDWLSSSMWLLKSSLIGFRQYVLLKVTIYRFAKAKPVVVSGPFFQNAKYWGGESEGHQIQLVWPCYNYTNIGISANILILLKFLLLLLLLEHHKKLFSVIWPRVIIYLFGSFLLNVRISTENNMNQRWKTVILVLIITLVTVITPKTSMETIINSAH